MVPIEQKHAHQRRVRFQYVIFGTSRHDWLKRLHWHQVLTVWCLTIATLHSKRSNWQLKKAALAAFYLSRRMVCYASLAGWLAARGRHPLRDARNGQGWPRCTGHGLCRCCCQNVSPVSAAQTIASGMLPVHSEWVHIGHSFVLTIPWRKSQKMTDDRYIYTNHCCMRKAVSFKPAFEEKAKCLYMYGL